MAMDDQYLPPKNKMELEKLLFRYSSALEEGDFETVGAVLKLAQGDAELERMILELNQAYQGEPEGAETRAEESLSSGESRVRSGRGEGGGGPEGNGGSFWDWFRGSGLRWAGGAALVLLLVALISFGLKRPENPFQTIAGPKEARATVVVEMPAATQAPAASAMMATPYPGMRAPSFSVITATPYPGAGMAGLSNNGGSSSAYPAPVQAAPQGGRDGSERLIVRDGTMVMIVEDTRASRDEIQKLVDSMADAGAFVVSSSESDSGQDGQPVIYMSLRVPVASFGSVMDALEKMAVRVLSRQEQSQDVTAEYVDQAARLQQLETARQRLLEIMKEAKTTDDLLRVESQLTQRETEIEALKGRVQYLSQTARLSSIQVELRPSVLNQPVVEGGWNPAETGRLAAGRLVESLRNFADFLITFAIATLPWLVVVGLVVYGLLRLGWKYVGGHREDGSG